MLVFAEVALSTLLLMTAALLARSFQQVTSGRSRIPFVAGADGPAVAASGALRQPCRDRELLQQVQPRVAALPGVRAVAAANVVPMNGYLATTAFFVDGVTAKDAPEAHYRMISPDYFRALGITAAAAAAPSPPPIAHDSSPVAIINETFARQYWPGGSPIGARMRLDDGEKVAARRGDRRAWSPT